MKTLHIISTVLLTTLALSVTMPAEARGVRIDVSDTVMSITGDASDVSGKVKEAVGLAESVKNRALASKADKLKKSPQAEEEASCAEDSLDELEAICDAAEDDEGVVNRASLFGEYTSWFFELMALLILALCPSAVVIVMLWMILRYLKRRNAERNRLIELSIREHTPLPPQFYNNPNPRTRLYSGMTWIAWGLGLLVTFCYTGPVGFGLLMLVPVLIGVARIVSYFLLDHKKPAGHNGNDVKPN